MNTILSSQVANSVLVTSRLAELRKEQKIFTAIQPCSGWGYHHATTLSTTFGIVKAECMTAHNGALKFPEMLGPYHFDFKFQYIFRWFTC